MPYQREFANPLGYRALLENEFLEERLKTFRFEPPQTEETETSLLELLDVRPLKELPKEFDIEDLRYAFAVDGSIARLEDEIDFELATLKLSYVVESLQRARELNEAKGVVDPDAASKLFKSNHRMVILGGRGIFGEDETEALWQDKFRQELWENIRHLEIPAATDGRTLNEYLKKVFPRHLSVSCFSCSYYHGSRDKDISVGAKTPACPRCQKDHYLSDGLFQEWGSIKSDASGVYLHLMTTLERLMLQATIAAAAEGKAKVPFEQTLFISDGSLAFYGAFSHLNGHFLKGLQSMGARPKLMSLEKGGVHAEWASRPEVQAILPPGSVAMIPTELTSRLTVKTQESAFGVPYAYGKRFLYRTQDGARTFVFMVPPTEGEPYNMVKSGETADSWENYAFVRLYCEFMERNTIDAFGLDQAALAVIAQANHEASLPKTLSAKTLQNLVRDLRESQGY